MSWENDQPVDVTDNQRASCVDGIVLLEALSTSLGFVSVAELDAWLQSPLVQPYWSVFRDHLFCHIDPLEPYRHPSFPLLVDQIANGTTDGHVQYSTDTAVDTSAWLKEDWYANFVFRCTRANRDDQSGIYRTRPIPLTDSREKTYEVLKLLVARACPAATAALATTGHEQPNPPDQHANAADAAEPTDGYIRVIWRNAAHPVYGNPASRVRQCLLQQPDRLTAVQALVHIRRKFRLSELGLSIGKLSELCSNNGGQLEPADGRPFARFAASDGHVMMLWVESCRERIQGLAFTTRDLDHATDD
ncbi:MAG: hypothetical protein M1826_004928 [Phylliscum demangeonii]|nr:MAG: hypothetical protein M1826_004928 [Phylliscum demangeonii]